MDTIFALATAPGRSGVAVIRVSGPKAQMSAQKITRRQLKPRQATLCDLRGSQNELIDSALVLSFPAPNSFTGEDVVEFHTHGSRAVTDLLQRELATFDEHRPAEAGEFTRRALTNGKMDLAQVEGLADVLEAQTAQQLRLAQTSLTGEFSAFITELREKVTRAAALLEATIDFADEDVPEDVTPEVVGLLNEILGKLQEQIQGFQFSERLKNGFEVAIVGQPNVGKSTLLNALAGRDAAITSKHAGTTRDVIEVQMDLSGIPVTFLDTAGLRETEDDIELAGIRLAMRRMEQADIRIFLVEGNEDLGVERRKSDLVVKAKQDEDVAGLLGVSGKTGAGISRLVELLTSELSDRVSFAGMATRERHINAMKSALKYLESAGDLVASGSAQYDVAAEEMRAARHTLGSVIGNVDVENLLDVIFSSFCVGK